MRSFKNKIDSLPPVHSFTKCYNALEIDAQRMIADGRWREIRMAYTFNLVVDTTKLTKIIIL